ncbi:MAG: SDR family oxidoreductase [Parvibaculaceae bacterium]|mgnify:FL=1|nr:SDR family oxidoreductase [Parvibaculaceae bacterium]|tara:strand:+ start:1620 stop:2486 length:867 start_codon:yes stop_codon:yes gene_type:complete
MEVQKTHFGFSDEELKALPTVYRADLFSEKTVVVSGGGSGFGKAIACLLARLGANVAICGRNEEKLAATVSLLESIGAQVFSRSLTIRDPDQVDGFIEAVWDKFGALDLLVNNAGGQFPQMALDFKVKGWNAVIDTNLNGTWYMMQSAARQWVDRKTPGSIVNIIADIWRGMPGIAHTCAARAGVAYLSKSVAVEWAPHRIRVNCVAPGVCETSGFVQYPPEGLKTYPSANPMLRVGDAHDIAEAVAYLASPGAKFITGEVLTVDGGEQLWGDPWPPGRPDYFQPKNT